MKDDATDGRAYDYDKEREYDEVEDDEVEDKGRLNIDTQPCWFNSFGSSCVSARYCVSLVLWEPQSASIMLVQKHCSCCGLENHTVQGCGCTILVIT